MLCDGDSKWSCLVTSCGSLPEHACTCFSTVNMRGCVSWAFSNWMRKCYHMLQKLLFLLTYVTRCYRSCYSCWLMLMTLMLFSSTVQVSGLRVLESKGLETSEFALNPNSEENQTLNLHSKCTSTCDLHAMQAAQLWHLAEIGTHRLKSTGSCFCIFIKSWLDLEIFRIIGPWMLHYDAIYYTYSRYVMTEKVRWKLCVQICSDALPCVRDTTSVGEKIAWKFRGSWASHHVHVGMCGPAGRGNPGSIYCLCELQNSRSIQVWNGKLDQKYLHWSACKVLEPSWKQSGAQNLCTYAYVQAHRKLTHNWHTRGY